MPDPSELSEGEVNAVLQKLTSATSMDKIKWEEGAESDVFQVVFKGGIVRIRQVALPRPDSPLFAGVIERVHYEADIVAPSGAVIQTLSPEHDAGQEMLKRLWELARGSALKPKQVLRNIDREINDAMYGP